MAIGRYVRKDRRMRVGLVGLIVCGCGSISDTQPDAARADASSDASVDAPTARCDVTKPFGSPVPVDGVNTTSHEFHGWLSTDQLTIYFARGMAAGDIYSATREHPMGSFTSAVALGGVNTSGIEDHPVLTADGLTMFMEVNYDIYVATRASAAAIFSAPAPVAGINTASSESHPWISDDGLVVYFSSNRAGTDDIFKATRASTSSPFSAAVAVGELNTMGSVYGPALSKDRLEIFFALNNNQLGDIFHATRSTPSDGFGTPRLVAELSGATTHEVPSWVSPDRCQLMFMSNRGGGSGGYDIWIATRPR
jgi:hypothetical protein